ncbi:MAG: sulfurtransferase [Alphaproteobacteria bacterium]|nr:sulfurtransferase [Alphaproteobacteria bacterium]
MTIQNFVRKGTISAQELKTLMDKKPPNTIILDGTFVLPTSTENPAANYSQKRIPGARFFDIEKISDQSSPLPHTVPSQEQFENGVSALGINPEDFIVVYGQHGMTMGPCRVWWMFRLFGHDNIAVLDGGLPEWIKRGGDMETSSPPSTPSSIYKAPGFRPGLLADQHQVRERSEAGLGPILDARPKDRFSGTAPEPRAGMLSGHIPGSLCLPSSSFVTPEHGTLKSDPELRTLFLENGVDLEQLKTRKAIASCGSGITACVIALALFRLGFDKISVYDGSWAEWGQKNAGNKIACGP